jgi:hypothetical protein
MAAAILAAAGTKGTYIPSKNSPRTSALRGLISFIYLLKKKFLGPPAPEKIAASDRPSFILHKII